MLEQEKVNELTEMSNEEYLKQSARTAPIFFNGRNITMQEMFNLMVGFEQFIKAGEELDKMKRHIFYNKTHEGMLELPDGVKEGDNHFTKDSMDLLHGVIGNATESSELAECFYEFLKGGELDVVNMSEELGDQGWYNAMIMRTLKTTIGRVNLQNIKKLYKRFKDKFNQKDAIIRDLEEERRSLEENQ